MRRIVSGIVALAMFANAAVSFAEAEKKGKRKHRRSRARREATVANNGGPFTDVPRGHWAYEAVQKAAEAGILQGWNNRFHGSKVVNRYQMAVVVARMLDRVGVLKANGKVITGQDIANLESLVIEFADELALLNVKVSTLEDTVAGLKRDVDLIKSDLRGVGARAGITGLLAVRGVWTGDNSPAYAFGPFIGPVATTLQPNPGATPAITRYRGGIVSGAGTAAAPFVSDSRQFITAAQFSLMIDREFDPHTHFHAHVDINAEGSRDALEFGAPVPAVGSPAAGRGSAFFADFDDINVNELYVTFDDWFTSGVAGRIGIYALPMNFEVNGPARTYQWTITPSVANTKWESIRPVGLDIFQNNERDSLSFYVGFFTPGDTSNGEFRSGSLLGSATGFTGFAAQTDPSVNPGGALAGLGRFPGISSNGMTDAVRGIDAQTLSSDDIGWYAYVGGHPTNRGHEGFTWHLAYFDRNGDLRPGLNEAVSATDWHAWQGAASYQFERFIIGGQYYDATSRNYNLVDLGITGITPDARRLNTTPFANVGGLDTDSESIMGFFNWQFSRRGSFTGRYENIEERTGLAEINADIWTAAFNWRTSDHGWFQLEWIDPNVRTQSENGFANTADVDDEIIQANYKIQF